MANLEVQIGADVQELLKKLDLTEKQLKQLAKQSNISGKKISEMGSKASSGVNKFGKSTVNALPATQEFSRVIQDMPFGIQGVGNNIQQLTANFGHLSKQAGGSGKALKAMVSSLAGPAGVLLAVSAVTSLLTVYQDEILGLISKTNKLAKATEEYTASANLEMSSLNALLAIARDETKSKQVRQNAINEINKNYSKYLGNLDLESVKTQTVTDKVKALTASLLQKAKVKGVEVLLEEKFRSLAEKTNSVLQNQTDYAKSKASAVIVASRKEIKAQQEILENLRKQQVENPKVATAIKQIELRIASLKKTADLAKRDDIAEGILSESIAKETEKIQKEIASLEQVLTISLADSFKGVDTSGSFEANEKKKVDIAKKYAKLQSDISNDLIKDQEEEINDFVKSWEGKGQVSLNDLIDVQGEEKVYKTIDDTNKKLIELKNTINRLGGDSGDFNLSSLDLSQLEALDNKLTSSMEVANIFTSAVGASFSALANEISQTFETGNTIVDAFLGSIINSLAQMATAAIQSLLFEKTVAVAKNQVNRSVSSGNAVTIATSAAAALGPFGAPALPGLIASQLALVNGTFAGIQAFAKGGFSGDNNLAYLNRNEMILRPFEQNALLQGLRGSGMSNITNNTTNNSMGGNVSFEIQGDKLIGVLNRSTKSNNRRGGNLRVN